MDSGDYTLTEYGVRKVGTRDDAIPAGTLDHAIVKKMKMEKLWAKIFGENCVPKLEIVKREVSPYWESVSEDDISGHPHP